jgi:hypothetical protein
VVAFRTFLRTLLHEVCHHLDYTYLRLPDSFHTQGFFQRESSLSTSSCRARRLRPAGRSRAGVSPPRIIPRAGTSRRAEILLLVATVIVLLLMGEAVRLLAADRPRPRATRP